MADNYRTDAVAARTYQKYVNRVRTHVANDRNVGPGEIMRRLELEAGDEGATDLLPSSRTVRRLVKEARELPPNELMPYRYVRWPESFGPPAGLPWGSARAVLDELALHQGLGGGRIAVRWATWFWKLRQSAPGEPDPEARAWIRRAAGMLAALEVLGGAAPETLQAFEGALAFRSFESEGDAITHGQVAYERAVREGLVPELPVEVRLPRETDDSKRVEALGELWGTEQWMRVATDLATKG